MSRIYSLRDAESILPEIAVVVQRLQDFREEVIALRDAHRRQQGVLDGGPGERGPADGSAADARAAGDVIRLRLRGVVDQMQADAAWLDARDIVLRDIATGLIDFPAEANGAPIWLCWRLGESSVVAWHRGDEGFAGRRPIGELD